MTGHRVADSPPALAGAPRLRPAPGVRAFPIGDEMVLYAPAERRSLALNRSARAVWELCAFGASADEVADALERELGLAPGALGDQVRATTGQLAALGLLVAERGDPGPVAPAT